MNSMNTLTVNSKLLSNLKIKETVLLLSGTALLQFIVHLIPSYNNIPMGAILIPMFYAPLIAVMFYGLRVGMITGALAPVINYALMGYPRPELVATMTLELALFALAVSFLLRYKQINKAAAPIAFVSAKTIAVVFMAAIPFFSPLSNSFFIQSIINALPGIAVLTLLNFMLIRSKEKV
jgi:hypothetical protein